MDLATGHQLFGLAIVYDWCYRDLDEPPDSKSARPCETDLGDVRGGGHGQGVVA